MSIFAVFVPAINLRSPHTGSEAVSTCGQHNQHQTATGREGGRERDEGGGGGREREGGEGGREGGGREGGW